MTDWAVAAHRGVPGSSGTGTVSCGLAGPLDGPGTGNVGMPSASAWCPGRRTPPCACSPLSKRPGSPSLVSVFPRSRCRITTGYTYDKHSAHLSPIATRHVDNSGFRCTHRRGWRFSQVRGLPWMRLGSGIPSISTAHAQAQRCLRTSHPHLCAQSAGKQPAGRADRQQPIGAPAPAVTQPAARTRGSGLGADEIGQEPGRGRTPPP